MCNIAGYSGNKQAAPILLEMLKRQEAFDGGASCGIVTIHEGRLYCRKIVGDVDTLIKHTDALYLPGNVGIAHTRPGGDARTYNFAHPFIAEGGRFAGITNGTTRGCRLAQPGEYTQRAFLNGKMDLSQAEAVADLIASTSAATHRLAMNQMRGGFSKELSTLRDKLLHLTSLMELELDFSDHEELEFADRSELSQIASDIERTVSRLAHSFSVGNAIKNGVPVAIIGETNVGKSTLLNALLGEERAIVSDIHGTTRDVIEDTVNLRGITFRFIDTAGIRQTTDVVESIGIERTFQKMNQADIVLWMIDSTNSESTIQNSEFRNSVSDKRIILLFNKSDQVTPEQREALEQAFANIDAPKLFISAKNHTGLEELETLLVTTAALPEVSQSDVIVTNLRHYEALVRALDSIHRVQDGLQTGLSGDFISQDLRECLSHLAEIVGGAFDVEDVLGNIFKHFCIGK